MTLKNFFIALGLCASLGNARAQEAGKLPDRIMLTWSADPTSTQSVSWRSDNRTGKVLGQLAEEHSASDLANKAITINGSRLWLDREPGRADAYQRVTFTDLKPATVYVYRVGDGENWSSWNQFRTADVKGDFSFIYLGDAQNDLRSLWSRSIRRAFQQAPNARFIMHGGDLINRSNTDSEWGEWYEGAGFIHQMIPAVPTPGNHEYTRNEARELVLDPHWKVQFNLPANGPEGLKEAVNYLDYQDLRVITLNSQMIMLDSVAAETQLNWLTEVLKSSTKKWNIVLMHHPVLSTAKNRDNTILRERFKPVFEQYGVDVVLQGHDHTYARGSIGKERPVYLLSVAGPKMYESDSERWMQVATSHTQLFQVIHITAKSLKLQAYKLNGELFDSFELKK